MGRAPSGTKEQPPQTIAVYDDSVNFGRGRSEVTIDFINTGAPFDAVLESSLLAKAGAKLGAAR